MPPLFSADDTTIYVVRKDVSSISETLSSALHQANEWLNCNHLSLNVQKTKVMLLHSSRRKNLPLLVVNLNESPVEQVCATKFLGVFLIDTLTWSDHIRHVSSKVGRNICLLRKLSWFLPQSALKLFYQSYLLPSFDDCDVVWNSCTSEEAATLERLQNYAARLSIHQRKGYSASAAKKQLGLATLSSRCAVHLAQQTAKSICGDNPIYLKQLFTPSADVHRHQTRHAMEGNVHLPLPKTNFGKKAFSYSGAAIRRRYPQRLARHQLSLLLIL